MTKFNEALDFLEATGDTSITTIMDCAKCSETVAKHALQAYNRNRGSKANKPKDEDKAQTADDIRQDKVSLGCKLYQEVCEADIRLFKMSTSIGMGPQETINNLKKKLEVSKSMLELAQFAKNLKKDDSTS